MKTKYLFSCMTLTLGLFGLLTIATVAFSQNPQIIPPRTPPRSPTP